MIKRIQNIQNVGAFREFTNGGSIQFEELTFIYGLNTKGKTTLTDILTSLKENDPSLITNRKSIPTVNTNQKVKVFIRPETTGSELPCTFLNNAWTQLNSNENLHIFGSDFIHKNLFTGLSIERQNKENLTRFILGQEGVQLATQIAEDKRLLRQKRSSLNNFLPTYLRDKPEGDHQPFLTIDPNSINLEQSAQELIDLEQRLRQEQQRLQRPSEILSIEDYPQLIIPTTDLENLITRINALLVREYNEISSAALARLQSHIENNFEITENAEQWIKEGLDTRKLQSENCSFCGQSLANATDLFNAYHAYFNEAYREFILDISDEIENLRRELQRLNFNSLTTVFAKQALLNQYSQLINNERFSELVSVLNNLLESIDENILNESISQYVTQINQAFAHKERRPYDKINSIDFSVLSESVSAYLNNVTSISEIISNIIEAISSFKEQYRDLTQIRARIREIQTEIETKSRIIARFEQNEQCIIYERERQQISETERRIATNEHELAVNQNQYLDRFYQNIDRYFKQFGSEHFTLERGTDNRGHQPVYYLKVKFRNVEIDELNISKVHSESDKRALALSVFWTKIDFLNDEQKPKAIIVLDDPVTSFDDNRIIKSINQLKVTLNSVRQIIVLTHYSHFIRNFLERGMNDDITIAFIQIEQNSTTSFLERINRKQFIETTYEKIFSKITAYINREIRDDIRSDLRPFLESQYLPHFYVGKLNEFRLNGIPCGSLSEMIDAIFIDNEPVKLKFHEFRTTLNPDSHFFTSNNEEDIRSFAREMMSYLYSFSHDI
jgi:wobble nucleotide-excising tRNase